jgi:hypothetical protein
MWKVKRMTPARIVVLAIAVGAGGIAAYLASGSDAPLPAPVAQLPTVDVHHLTPDSLQFVGFQVANVGHVRQIKDIARQILGFMANGFATGSIVYIDGGALVI